MNEIEVNNHVPKKTSMISKDEKNTKIQVIKKPSRIGTIIRLTKFIE
jgi:hypothetical protein